GVSSGRPPASPMVNVPAGIRTISPADTPTAGAPESPLPQPATPAKTANTAHIPLLDMIDRRSPSSQSEARTPKRHTGPQAVRGSRLGFPRLVPRRLIVSGVPQHVLRPGADLRGDRRDPGVEGDEDARPLPQGLDHPSAFAHQLVLVAADLHQGPGVRLA